MWTTAVRYVFNKSLGPLLQNSRAPRPTSTLDGHRSDAAFSHPYQQRPIDVAFKPKYIAPLRRPRNDADAQELYNHIRTVAWYLDALPLGTNLPFNIGFESIVGFIPVVGDYIGLVLGLYQVFLCSLFGLPLVVLLWMLLNVVLDCIIGLTPVVGDLLDIAFKSNLRNLHLLEDSLQSSRGVCGAGRFYIRFPPADAFIEEPLSNHPDANDAFSAPPQPPLGARAARQSRSKPGIQPPAYFMNLPASVSESNDFATALTHSSETPQETEAYTIPDEPFFSTTSPTPDTQHYAATEVLANTSQTTSTKLPERGCVKASEMTRQPSLEVPRSDHSNTQNTTDFDERRLSTESVSRPRVSWHDEDIQTGRGNGKQQESFVKGLSVDFERNAEHPRNLWRHRRNMYLVVYSAIFCVAYITSLDANTAYLYLNFACSEYGALASFSTVAIVQQMIYAVAKPPIAKLSDVFGRPQAYGLSLVFYMGGYLIVASSTSLRSLISGICLQSAGNTGVQVLQSIIIADTTTAKWRGLVIGIVNLPFLINFAVAGPMVDVVMRHGGWRAGFGIWTLLVPISALPLLITLVVGQRRARKAGLTVMNSQPFAMRELAVELDLLGLVLFTGGWLLILLPLTLAGHGERSAGVPMFTFVLGGTSLLLVFLWWESKASVPMVPYRFFRNKAVVCTCIVGVLDFASFYISWTFLSSFIQILKGWDQTKTGYFATTQNVTSTITGIVVGSLMAMTRRYKTLLVGGLIVRLVGVTLMIRFRTADHPTYMLVLCQLLQGIGGGSIAITMQVAVQVTVRHADVAIVTALELLTTEIGAAIGSATAGWVFQTHLPRKLAIGLPAMDPTEIKELYGSLQKALSYPIGSMERAAITQAWVEVMHILSITATIVLVPAVLIGLAIPDAALPDVHGSVSHSAQNKADRRYRRRRSSILTGSRPSSPFETRAGLSDITIGPADNQHSRHNSHRSRSISQNRYSSISGHRKTRRHESRDRLAST